MSDVEIETVPSTDTEPEEAQEKPDKKESSLVAFFIDPQNDFYTANKTQQRKQGSLGIPGGTDALLAALRYLESNTPSHVIVMLDTHTHTNIGHPSYWVDEDGGHPLPYTTISAADIETEQWSPLWGKLREYTLKYARRVEQNRHHSISIWPYHAIENTKGHAVVAEVQSFLAHWSQAQGKSVTYLEKGKNPHTEFYSAFRAEVPVKADKGTELNQALIDQLLSYDKVLVIGQSHSLDQSVRDLVDHIPADRHADIILLKQATMVAPGARQLLAFAQEQGITIL